VILRNEKLMQLLEQLDRHGQATLSCEPGTHRRPASTRVDVGVSWE
jgi:hypothetical protein